MLGNKYSNWYFSIIKNAKNRGKPTIYCEKHHILPKSLGGSNSQENLVWLTAREHYLCHWLLTKCYEGKEKSKMIHAFWCLMNQKTEHQERTTPCRVYQIARECLILHRTDAFRGENNPNFGNRGPRNPLYGKPQPEWQRTKAANAKIGKSLSEEHKRTLSNKASLIQKENPNRAKWYVLIHKHTGDMIEVKNLRKFCRENSINEKSLRKGWGDSWILSTPSSFPAALHSPG